MEKKYPAAFGAAGCFVFRQETEDCLIARTLGEKNRLLGSQKAVFYGEESSLPA